MPKKGEFKLSPEKLSTKIEEYFASLKGAGKDGEDLPPTKAGLRLHCGLSIDNIGSMRERSPVHKVIIDHAHDIIEDYFATQLALSKHHSANLIFTLKNCGWTDRPEAMIQTKGPIEVTITNFGRKRKKKQEEDGEEEE